MQMTGLKGARLSLQQRRLWSFLQDGNHEYRTQCAVLLTGRLDEVAFQQSFQQMIAQHEILRTVFYTLPDMDVPVQVIGRSLVVPCPVVNLEGMWEPLQKSLFEAHFAWLQQEPFDLAHGPLVRAMLLRLSPTTHLLILSLSALCADAATLPLLLSELGRRYAGKLQGQNEFEEPLQYVDIAAWLQKLREAEGAKAALEFWEKLDLAHLRHVSLPFIGVSDDKELRNGVSANEIESISSSQEVVVHGDVLVRLQGLAQQYEVPLSSLLLTCWFLLLARMTDSRSVLIGCSGDGRIYEEITDVPGLYTRFVPVYPTLDPGLPFDQVVQEVQKHVQEAMKQQLYFRWPVEDQANGMDEQDAYFPITFEFEQWNAVSMIGDLHVELLRSESCTDPFILKLSALQMDASLSLHLHYHPQKVSIEAAQRLTIALQTLLESVAQRPQIPVGILSILASEDEQSLLELFRGPTRPLHATSFHQLFEAQAAQLPGACAVLSAEGMLTYQELNERANQLARLLQRRGVGPNVCVGLCISRSIQMIVTLLAILKAGGAYVPLDVESPAARLAYQLQDIEAPLLLTQRSWKERLPAWDGQLLLLEELESEIALESKENLPNPGNAMMDLAYVIYTSGSTGASKGVMVRQSNVVNYTLALCDLLGYKPGRHFATVSTLAADLGNTSIFCALASGGCIQVLNYEMITSVEAFASWSAQHPIDVLKIVPSHLAALLASDEHALAVLPGQILILGGETLSPALLARLRQLNAQCVVYNHYGPTETTIGALVNQLGMPSYTPAFDASREHIPLGQPIANVDICVLDGFLQVVPQGVTGELCIGGSGLTLGYLHQAKQTAERFIPHPFSPQPGARLYRTGDLVRITSTGEIEFLGRLDRQVKLRGYRIELGEIEAVLKRHPDVWDGVIDLREDAMGELRLIGYVVPKNQPAPTINELRSYIREHLPEQMVPFTFVMLKDLPLTVNGKIDHRQLPMPESGREEQEKSLVLPRSPIEELLLEIWKDVLNIATCDIYDDFFQLGGHSLLATQILSRVRVVAQVELSIIGFFEEPTIAGMARQIESLLQGQHQFELQPLLPQVSRQELPLSFAQQRLWFLHQMQPQNTAYLICSVRQISGPLNQYALQRSLDEVVSRHESLRTNFPVSAGRAVQVIHPFTPHPLPVVDLSGIVQELRTTTAQHLSGVQQPFDLAHDPLLRTVLLRLDTQEHVLLITMHHIISDGWSNNVFNRELFFLYHAFSAEKLSPLKPLPIQYADFTLWQRQRLQGEFLEHQLDYWRRQLSGLSLLELPTDHPRPAVQTSHGAFMRRAVPPALHEALVALSQREGVTLFMLLLAAFQVLLARYTGQDDISIGTPIANRTRSEIEGLIGFFVNTLVLRTVISSNPSFIQLLERVRKVALDAYAHQEVPFEYLVEELVPERNLNHSPFFQVMFTLQQAQEVESGEDSEAQTKLTSLATEHRSAKFDMTLFVMNSTQSMYCGIEYNTDLFEPETIQRLLEHWNVLLEGIVAAPHTAVAALPLLTKNEQLQLLDVWNHNLPEEQPRFISLHALFAQHAADIPDAVALQYEGEQSTYAHINRCANQLAHKLMKMQVGPGAIVGIALERSPLLIVSILAVLKVGGVYLPIDPSVPEERQRFVLDDARVAILLTQPDVSGRLELPGLQVLCMTDDWSELATEDQGNPAVIVDSAQPAYVIYTSGSTGTPKGVQVSHANVLRLFTASQDYFHFGRNDIWTLFHSYSFDFSVWEIWGPLLYGGKLVIVSYVVSRDPEAFSSLLSSQAVTVLNQTPSAFRQLMQLDMPDSLWLRALRYVIFGGEALELQRLLPWFERYGDREPQLVNMYGITETTVHVTYRPLRMQDALDTSGSLIGQPLPDLQLYVLDEYLQLLPVGVAGQIYVGGAGLAHGYLKRADLTSERFVPHPFSSRAGMRLYKTGDRARFLSNGELEYLGRVDQQVKIRGYRIEPGEIEHVLLTHPAIQECVVLAQEDMSGDKRLAAYIVPAAEKVSPGELHNFLLEYLPDYMVPAFFITLEALPLTQNGKLDRGALPALDGERPDLDASFIAPRTSSEEILAAIWSAVLGIEQIGIHDNFFVLGGDSMRSIQVLAQAHERGLDLSVQEIFQYPTIYTLAQTAQTAHFSSLHVEGSVPFGLLTTSDRLQLPDNVEDAYPLAMLQAGMLFHSQYNPGSAVYYDIISYHLQAAFNAAALKEALRILAQSHPILRTSFDLRSYHEPLQLVWPEVEIPLRVDDLRSYGEHEQEALLAFWLDQDKLHPFNWEQAPLLRFQVHRRSESSFQLSLSLHHAILDGWSVATLLTELFRLYQMLLSGAERVENPPLALRFHDFVALEQRLKQTGEAQRFWSQKLSGGVSTQLPRWSNSGYDTEDNTVYVQSVPIAQETSLGLKKLARELAVPIKSVLLAAHLRVLSVLYGQNDVITGLVANGRPETAAGERVLGLFLNTLPFRFDISGRSWSDLIRAVFEAECELLPYRWYPLAEIQKQQRSQNLFELIFNFTHFHVYQGVFGPTTSQDDVHVIGRTGFEKTNFALATNFSLDPVTSETRLSLRCNVAQISHEQIEAIAGYYDTALTAIAQAPEKLCVTQSLLSAYEYQQILLDWNATEVSHPEEKGIHRLFEEQVARTPQQVALVFDSEQLTYEELNGRANQLARYLRSLGVRADCLVGLCMERSPEMLIGLLGILKAGGAYVPLDPAYPVERLTYMMQDSQLTILLTQSWLVANLPVRSEHVLCLDGAYAETVLSGQAATDEQWTVFADQLAYVIYTSGSTGYPKGTAISHRAVRNFFHSMAWQPEMMAQDRVLGLTSLSFDIAVLELLLPLTLGAQVHGISREIAADGQKLMVVLDLEAITLMQATPTTWRLLLSAEWKGNANLKMLCGGEVLPLELASQLLSKGAELWNMYGPTETTIWSTTGRIGEDVEFISIGGPIENTRIYLLDQEMLPVPIGVTGELYIAGAGLARNYLHHADLTAASFLPDPFSMQAGDRMYRTGDLARWHPDGSIECLGRSDRQVKLRGFRIELGEIENVLEQYPEVQTGVVLVREDIPGKQQLVAYVVPTPDTHLTVSLLRNHLQEQLPYYMVPAYILLLDELPLTPNGKIDRRSLPTPELLVNDEHDVLPSRTPLEEILTGMWQALLGIGRIDVHDNFFELGGHSLLATQLISRIRGVLQVEVSLRRLFEAPTIAGLAQCVVQIQQAEKWGVIPELVAMERPEVLPLSFAQQRLWFLDQLEPGSTAYLMPSFRRLRGYLNVQMVELSIQEIVQRQESLRTTFQIHHGQAAQVIHPIDNLHLPLFDLSDLVAEVRETAAQKLIEQLVQQPFDLVQGPLFRVSLLRMAEQEHLLLVTLHHIIADEWSMQIFYRELVTLYQTLISQSAIVRTTVPIQYADFTLWQRQWLQGEVLEDQMAYWRHQLTGILPLELPTDHPRPPVQTYRGAKQSLRLSSALRDDLQALSQRAQVTMFMLLLAAFQVLLARYSRQQDISVGTPIANRGHKELEGLIGFFVNTLVMRAWVQDDLSFMQFVAQVREMALDAYAHQDVPFEQLVEVLQPERDMSRPTLVQVMFALQQQTILAPQAASPVDTHLELQQHGMHIEHSTTKFDLTLDMSASARGLSCEIEYNIDLFDAGTIQRLLQHWETLLESIVATPESPLADLSMLTEAEVQQVLFQWNATNQVQPAALCVHQAIEVQVERMPDAVALVFEDTILTYQQFDHKVAILAACLQQAGIGPEGLVGVYMERSLELMIALVAIFKAGGAYIPLDPGYPQERLEWMLSDAAPSIILTQAALLQRVPLPFSAAKYCYVEQEITARQNDLPVDLAREVTPENLAYVIYTSGSTGKPKGVMNTHKGVWNRLWWMQQTYHLEDGDSIVQKAPVSFDASVVELFWSLTAGAKLVIAGASGQQDPAYLLRLIEEQSVTALDLVPSLLQMLLDVGGIEQCRSLQQVFSGGETLPAALHERFFASTNAELHNLYGPTEAAVDVAFWRCERDSRRQTIPIGHPIANMQIYLLDARGNPVPVGVAGELYIGGIGVARGYLKRADLTALRFVPHPWGKETGERLYRTGDLARYDADGAIEYLGRADQQVKVRGYRIELGEIEYALECHAGVAESAVVVQEGQATDRRLFAYVVLTRQQSSLKGAELRNYLLERIPEYMVPARVIVLDELPLLPNGKVNRNELLHRNEEEDLGQREEEWSQVEEILGQVWEEVLRTPIRERERSFFELGGHSLLATQIVARMRSVLDVDIPLRTLFEDSTIALLARRVEQELRGGSGQEAPPLLPVAHVGMYVPLSFAQQRLWLEEQLNPGSSAYLITSSQRLRGALMVNVLERSVEEIALRHESLRTTFQAFEGEPMQIVDAAAHVALPTIDLRGLDQNERMHIQQRLSDQEKQVPCDLIQGPLVRITLIRLDDEDHVLLLTMHHIISDGWSSRLFEREIAVLYQALAAGRPSPLPALAIQYADFAIWQRQWLQEAVMNAHLVYWRKQLAGMTPLRLPTDRPHQAIQSHRGAMRSFGVPAELIAKLVDLSCQEGVTLFMLMLTAFEILLQRYCKQNDIVVGTDVSNRSRVEIEGLIGFFINQLVLRVRLDGNDTFVDTLKQVRHMALEAYTHQDLPFEKLVEALRPKRSLQHAPIFQVKIVWQDTSHETSVTSEDADRSDLTSSPLAQNITTVKLDLLLNLSRTRQGLRGSLIYNTDIFDADTIAAMEGHYVHILQSICADSNARLDALEMFSPEEKARQKLQRKEREASAFADITSFKPQPVSLTQEMPKAPEKTSQDDK